LQIDPMVARVDRGSHMTATACTAHLATYPAREHLLKANIARLRDIFGEIVVCLNEYSEVPHFLRGDERIHAAIPKSDWKDAGKFLRLDAARQNTFLIDDDIIYPFDYAMRMIRYAGLVGAPAVLGVHGVDYLECYTGGVDGRRVYHFKSALSKFTYVDTLGTGTVMLAGVESPPWDFMASSIGFVDIRFARYCAQKGIPRVCVPRHWHWLRACRHVGSTLFLDITSRDSPEVLRDVNEVRRLRRYDHQPLGADLDRLDRLRFFLSEFVETAYRTGKAGVGL
jgi:hypothetical protein